MTDEIRGTHWRAETDDDSIVWLHLDKADSTTNTLSSEVLEELLTMLGAIGKHNPKGLVFLSSKKNGFIAGADVSEFPKLTDTTDARRAIRAGQSVMDRIDALPFPTVAMIHGFCVGGGLELALACRYRVAENGPRTRLGLPEVMLGIHPAFGGTMRMIRTVGAPHGMDLMLTGRTVSARAARRMGLVDHAVSQRHLKNAARSLVLNPPAPQRPGPAARIAGYSLLRPWFARYLRRKVSAKASKEQYPAPYALIELWERYADEPQRMLEAEAESGARLIISPTARNLLRVFFLRERLKSAGREQNFDVNHVHVVGAGTMGGDIAAWCAMQGLRVTVQDTRPEGLARAVDRAYGLYRKRLKQPREVQAAMDRLIPDLTGAGAAHADLVIEAIFENVDAKQALLRDLVPRMKPDALLATNTSSIPLETLAEVLTDPGRLVGLHFFNPVAKMPLVEIVTGPNTTPETAARAAAFARRIDRLPLPVKSAPGFLVNRILMPYLLEAVTLEAEGVPAVLIDRAAVRFGMPMGPVELADSVGLDVCLSVAEILAQRLGGAVPARLKELVANGRLGRKSGHGFYKYAKDKPVKPRPDKSRPPPADLTDRLILPMLDEAVACLREQVVENGDLVDAGMVFGTGFAPFRGGPMHYIRDQGADVILRRMQRLEQSYGARFAPDIGWSDLKP
ncbi:MAG: crotonase [Chromatiales bacterium 21-64-14]|nr:MAG: crotonase [Chromatiales bacterium 21-64-14]HQU16334.1 3-hydroxyacyl-CoA dehydrogenase NAD-binding domain-containing protein [Gammaproteobacteria bacterium]